MPRALDAEPREVRVPAHLASLDGPRIRRRIDDDDAWHRARGAHRAAARAGPRRHPGARHLRGTILLDREHLGLADYTCRRNASPAARSSRPGRPRDPRDRGGRRAVFISRALDRIPHRKSRCSRRSTGTSWRRARRTSGDLLSSRARRGAARAARPGPARVAGRARADAALRAPRRVARERGRPGGWVAPRQYWDPLSERARTGTRPGAAPAGRRHRDDRCEHDGARPADRSGDRRGARAAVETVPDLHELRQSDAFYGSSGSSGTRRR